MIKLKNNLLHFTLFIFSKKKNIPKRDIKWKIQFFRHVLMTVICVYFNHEIK